MTVQPQSTGESVTFGVRVTTKPGGYLVDVWHPHGNGPPRDFAKIDCGDLWTALRMALPYMAHAAQPDPFSDLVAEATRRG